ncbi:MAG: saccharopine dehydrogenase, partial [Actinomycetota bacterium]|nr:saccharopine dehydrogenase [Actinomycetota bacterium]
HSGARLVHACGFDSVPHDLGVWFTLDHLPRDKPLSIAGFVRAHARFSAGTFHSAVRAFGRARQASEAARLRRQRESRARAAPSARRVGSLPLTPRRLPGSGRWAMPLPTIDPIIIRRSARALDRYGPDFRYGHYADVGGLPLVAASTAGAASLMAAAQVPLLRDGLLRLKSSGEGPDEQRRSQSWFRVRFVSTVGGGEADPILTEVSGGDPGYDETAKMLAESALSLAFDDLPDKAGQLTPVEAMGDALLGRLQRSGMKFRALSSVT